MLLFANLRQNWISSSLLSITLLGSLTLGATEAKAIDFTDTYVPNNWTTDQTATGSVTQDTFTLTMTFDSGIQNDYIDQRITIDPTGVGQLITFNWNFISLETANIHSVGYVINNAYTTLVYSSGEFSDFDPVPQSGTGRVNVAAGDSFAFRIQAELESSSGGEFAITNFNATPVPFETDTLPLIGSTVLFGLGIWAKGKLVKKK
jgi:hypothetical protein